MHRQIIAAAAASLLLFTLAGCGDKSKDPARSADETKAIGSLTTKIGSGANASSVELFGADFPGCFAEKLVDGAGVDQLVKDKVLTADMEAAEDFAGIDKVSDKSAAAFADAEYECIDWDAVSTYLKDNKDLAKVDDAHIDDYVACMTDIDADTWKAASQDQAMGKSSSDAITAFGDATAACQKKITP